MSSPVVDAAPPAKPSVGGRVIDLAGTVIFGFGVALGLWMAPACMMLPSWALVWIGFAIRMRRRPVVGMLGGFLIGAIVQAVGLSISENLYHLVPFGAD